MKYLSLFSGIGGFELGIDKAYEDLQNIFQSEELKYETKDSAKLGQRKLDTKFTTRLGDPICIGYSEIDKYAIQVYKKHFKHRNYGDITKINAAELPEFDLLVGGFPCQAFSIAGKRRGFDDTRGTLFFDIARILKERKPRNFILENVKGLLSHDGGNTFKTIIATLAELGYCVEWQVLNAKNFGVPQNRERVFIVGHFGGLPERKVFPIGENGGVSNEELQEPVQREIQTNGQEREQSNIDSEVLETGENRSLHRGQIEVEGTLEGGGWEKRHEQIRRVHGIEGISPTIPTGTGGGVMTKIAIPMRWVKTEKGKEYRREAQKQGKDLTLFNDGYRKLVESKEKVSGCITNALQKDALLKHDMKIRRLTPLECERLQGFPDGWTEGLSDTQRYKTLGNGVVSNVVAEIVKLLINTR